jgi:hypothetical protein
VEARFTGQARPAEIGPLSLPSRRLSMAGGDVVQPLVGPGH